LESEVNDWKMHTVIQCHRLLSNTPRSSIWNQEGKITSRF
jgi:hypothetical protein